MGEDYYNVTFNGTTCRRIERKTELRDLTSLFFHTVKPSQLLTLAILISNVSNLGDFVNSMRLMCATRTSEQEATRIEAQD
jgi:hypothetical protein